MFDTTETFGTDNLHSPEGIIEESMEEIAKVYGVKHSLYVVNGSTGALHIALMSATNPGDRILIQRNSHIGVYNGAILSGLDVEYLMPYYDQENQVVGDLKKEEVLKVLNENEDIKAIVLLHPSFYGICGNLKEIIDICHERNIIVIVDEAHGPHMYFNERLPKSACELGADLIIHSSHKTLPAMTQTALLHVNSDRVDIDDVRLMSRMLQTTSPSYIFMTNTELAVNFTDSENGRKRLSDICEAIDELEEKLSNVKGIHVLSRKQDELFYSRDFTKLMIEIEGIKGARLRNILHEDYSIDMEYADLRHVIGIVTLMNTREDIVKLYEAILDINENYEKIKIHEFENPLIRPDVVMSISKAFYANSEILKLEDAVGRISASYINPYPPGIPQLAPGERITKEHLDLVKELSEVGISIVGLKGKDKNLIKVVVED